LTPTLAHPENPFDKRPRLRDLPGLTVGELEENARLAYRNLLAANHQPAGVREHVEKRYREKLDDLWQALKREDPSRSDDDRPEFEHLAADVFRRSLKRDPELAEPERRSAGLQSAPKPERQTKATKIAVYDEKKRNDRQRYLDGVKRSEKWKSLTRRTQWVVAEDFLRHGHKMQASHNTLAAELKVSRSTIRRARDEAVDKGVLLRQFRSREELSDRRAWWTGQASNEYEFNPEHLSPFLKKIG